MKKGLGLLLGFALVTAALMFPPVASAGRDCDLEECYWFQTQSVTYYSDETHTQVVGACYPNCSASGFQSCWGQQTDYADSYWDGCWICPFC